MERANARRAGVSSTRWVEVAMRGAVRFCKMGAEEVERSKYLELEAKNMDIRFCGTWKEMLKVWATRGAR